MPIRQTWQEKAVDFYLKCILVTDVKVLQLNTHWLSGEYEELEEAVKILAESLTKYQANPYHLDFSSNPDEIHLGRSISDFYRPIWKELVDLLRYVQDNKDEADFPSSVRDKIIAIRQQVTTLTAEYRKAFPNIKIWRQ